MTNPPAFLDRVVRQMKGLIRYLPVLLLTVSFTQAALAQSSGNLLLTVKFLGMSSVYTDVRVTDGIPAAASGVLVKASNYTTDGTTIEVPPGVYDLRLRKGASIYMVDSVNCESTDPCIADELTATFTAWFPGLTEFLPG